MCHALFLVVLWIAALSCRVRSGDLSGCRVQVGGRVISLTPLQATDRAPRFQVDRNGWTYAFSPCRSFNLPVDPHMGNGDLCAYVALCRFKKNEFYTMGIQRTAGVHLTRNDSSQSYGIIHPSPALGADESEESEEDNDDSDEEEGDEDDDDDDDDDEEEEEEKEEVIDEEANSGEENGQDITTAHESDGTIEIIYKGIRSVARIRSHVVLTCDRSLSGAGDAVFHATNHGNPRRLMFELRHLCCCPGACEDESSESESDESESGEEEDDEGSDLEEAPRLLWLLVVVNGLIIAIAVVICRLCSYQGVSSDSPYNYLPALHGSRVTLYSIDSFKPTLSGGSRVKHVRQVEKVAGLTASKNCLFSQYELTFRQRLGGGTFCDTYLADYKRHHLAAKRITVGVHRSQLTPGQSSWLLREIKSLSMQTHANLVRVIGVCLDTREPYVMTEFVVGESLADLLNTKRQTSLHLTRNIDIEGTLLHKYHNTKQLHYLSCPALTFHRFIHTSIYCSLRYQLYGIQTAEGMEFLQYSTPPVLHRDLRSANILVSADGKAKVVDYGHTRLVQRFRKECDREECFCNKAYSAIPASLRWTAPEILRHPTADESNSDVFTASCDVYSYGMVLWEIVTSAIPFYDILDEKEVMKLVINGVRPAIDTISKVPTEYLYLMEECWGEYSEHRPSFTLIIGRMKSILHSLSNETANKRSLGDSYTVQFLALDKSFD